MAPRTEAVAGVIRENIETIARLEEEFKRKRTLSDRAADRISDFTGSMTFVVVHAILFGVWIVLNLGMVPGISPWDKYPFPLMVLAVSLEAIFLSTFVLIKQVRMSRRADELAHLDLQINLLSEREMTLVLQMLQSVCARLDVAAPHQEVCELAAETRVEAVANELERAMSPETEAEKQKELSIS
jgi:uncharacterized membrane protein